jgi:hypothetical protein
MEEESKIVVCCIEKCFTTSESSGLQLYPLVDLNPEQLELWIKVVIEESGKWKNGPNGSICSRHFVTGSWSGLNTHHDFVPNLFPKKWDWLEANCKVRDCPRSTTDSAVDVPLFSFPFNDVFQVKKWCDSLRVETINETDLICALHFDDGCPSMDPLHVDYSPTLHLPDEDEPHDSVTMKEELK